MNELIKVEINENQEPIVSGRELHEFLEVKTAYKDWFPRMIEYGFIENTDFQILIEKVDAQKRARTYEQFNHALKIDMAKEIAMLQRNEQGKKARQYFIQIEKDWNTPEKVIARALILANRQIDLLQVEKKQQQQIIGELKPKADYTDTILKSTSLVTINQIAKDYGISGQALNNILHDAKVQYKQSEQWLLYAAHQACGYTHSQTINITRTDGSADVKMNTKWTQKGRLFIYNLLKNKGLVPTIEKGM